jgi:hypothetical protein
MVDICKIHLPEWLIRIEIQWFALHLHVAL